MKMVLFITVLVFLIVGDIGFYDEQKQEQRYCELVQEGVHTDYKELGDAVCQRYQAENR